MPLTTRWIKQKPPLIERVHTSSACVFLPLEIRFLCHLRTDTHVATSSESEKGREQDNNHNHSLDRKKMSEPSPAVIKKTQDTLGKYVKRPPLTDKLLKKPPFRFLHDVINAVINFILIKKG